MSASPELQPSEANEADSRPKLLFFYTDSSGRSRRVESFLAQVLQRRRNHDTFQLYRVDCDARPDLAPPALTSPNGSQSRIHPPYSSSKTGTSLPASNNHAAASRSRTHSPSGSDNTEAPLRLHRRKDATLSQCSGMIPERS